MKKLNNLRKAVKVQSKERLTRDLQYFEEHKTLEEKEKYVNSWAYKKNLAKQYKLNNAKTEKQKINVLKSLIKAHEKENLDSEITKIEQAENYLNSGSKILSLCITIDWVKNRTWEANPHAEICLQTTDDYKTANGTASGCGYDKESAATSSALNAISEIKALMYLAANKKKLPYGSGHYALPYFEDGVGQSSINRVLEAMGFKKISEAHGNTYDLYTFRF